MRLEINRYNTFVRIGIFLLLFISFFIGFQEKHHFVKNAYLIMQIVAVFCLLIAENVISRDQKMLPIIALLCIAIVICNKNARLAHGSFAVDSRICTAFLVYFLINRRTDWYKTLIKSLVVLGIFYGVTTVYLYIFPAAYSRYVYPIFGQESTIVGTVQKGYAVGFSRHFSTTAIYHTVTLGVPICVIVKKGILEKKHTKLMFFLIGLIYIGVLLTGKRAHSIFIPLAIIVCYYIFGSGKKMSVTFKIVGGIILFLGMFYICAQIIPSLNNVMIRFQNKIERGDITSGRDVMLEECKFLFINNPIIGSGWGSFAYNTVTGVKNAHNVYAQLFAENGLVLSIPFFIFFIGNIWHTCKAINIIIKKEKRITNTFMICLIYSLYIQVFFILYSFTGNPLYDFQFVFPYILGCAIGENAYRVFYISNQAICKQKWKTIR